MMSRLQESGKWARRQWEKTARFDPNDLDRVNAFFVTSILISLIVLRYLIGPVVFTAGVSAAITLLFARNARYLWKVFVFVAVYGAVVTSLAQHVDERDRLALVFIWIVTFLSSLGILMPVANAVLAMINLWALIAMNVTAESGTVTASANSWIIGSGLAVACIWAIRRGKTPAVDESVDLSSQSFTIARAIRRHVFEFAMVRATAVALAGLVGHLFFTGNDWLIASVTLVVIGISKDKSEQIAIQRGVGTLVGVAVALVIGSLPVGTSVPIVLTVGFIYLAVLFQKASAFFFAAFLTAAIVLIAGLRQDALVKFAGDRMLQTMVGIGIGLLAVRMLRRRLEPIGEFTRQRRQVSNA